MDDDSVLLSIEFKQSLIDLGFKHLGSGWYGNKLDDIRLRLWLKSEVDFWLWRSSRNTDDNEIRFRGRIDSIEDVKWVLERCFGITKENPLN